MILPTVPDILKVSLNLIIFQYLIQVNSGSEIEVEQVGNPEDVHFLLFTTNNVDVPYTLLIDDEDTLANSPFIPDAPVKVLTHGFQASTDNLDSFPSTLRAKYLNQTSGDLNVIEIDWKKLAKGPLQNYPHAAANTKVAGGQGAKLIEFLIRQNVTTVDNFHLIGHSLGAHVSGIIGHHIFTTFDSKVPRISGLDPAKPLFQFAHEEERLDRNDGDFVDIIHTNGLTLALFGPLGTVDFYPNGGIEQPGCHANPVCSHSRAHEYFVESVSNPEAFRSCKCPDPILDTPVLINCSCDNGTDSVAHMGDSVATSSQGVFSLKTNRHSPYSKE